MRNNLRAAIADEARRAAAVYYREYEDTVENEGDDWVVEAWADLRRDFQLSAVDVIEAWPLYWGALREETKRRAAGCTPER
jgi:hypothetical protein